MRHFLKSLLSLLLWLLISELLCLILSFSFAIMRAEIFRWMSLFFGALAHILLMGNAGRNIAAADAAEYRISRKKRPVPFSVGLGICTAIPLWIVYLILHLLRDSGAALNAFLLLNAPFIQYHRLILDGAEPFSALSAGKQLLMALPPLVTATSVIAGYQLHYQKTTAELDASKHLT